MWGLKGARTVNAEGPSTDRSTPVRPEPARSPAVLVQRKLAVGAADDPLETEADQAADDVMRILRSLTADGSSPPGLGGGRATRVQRHAAADHHDHDHGHDDHGSGPEVGLAGGAISDQLSSRIKRAGGGVPLGDRTLARMEHGFGASFADVRVHPSSDLPSQVAAEAFTTGTHLHFAPGLYDPSSASGERLLAHELAHVVQQGGAVSRRPVGSEDGAKIARRHVCSPGCGHDESLTDSGPMLADELLHAMRRPALVSRSTSADRTRMIRRHASWEHKMLGDVDPATLEVIALGRDVAAEAASAKGGWMSKATTPKTIKSEAGKTIDLETVLHTIDQEITRLKLFQLHPPEGKVVDATKQLEKLDADARKAQIGPGVADRAQAEKAIDDAKWGVRLVSLKLKDGKSFLVTYGEMNTLADFYGSADEIAQTPADNFRAIVGGVREESIRKFMRLRNELAGGGPQTYDPDADEHNIAGAIGNKGTKVGSQGKESYFVNSDQYGELKLMGEMKSKQIGDEQRARIDNKEETSYTAGLGRNACHFAPHSWHAWAAAHLKGVALATEAWNLNKRVAALRDQIDQAQSGPSDHIIEGMIATKTKLAEELDAQAEDKLNSALIENGFGDHFLQDSYAAGHLINKTLIMQWFVKWLDKGATKRTYTEDNNWRQVQQMAYGQSGLAGTNLYDKSTIGRQPSNDPQSVENMGGDWTGRFAALGLQIPGVLTDPAKPEFKFFTWWQEQAMDGKLLSADWGDLDKAQKQLNGKALQAALIKLIDDGVVYYGQYSTSDRGKGAAEVGLGNMLYNKSLCIKREYIPKKKDEAKFKLAVQQAGAGDTAAYSKMAKAVTYADYHKFLNHGYMQLASNVLHDYFCKNGLKVATAENAEPYLIYGDNAMLSKESSKMVKYSAETSHQSRDSIYQIAATGRTDLSTDNIAARFPLYARPVGEAKNLRLDVWHGDNGSLHKFCNDTIFDKEVAAFISKSTIIAKDVLSGKISKDATEQIHSGEAF